MSKTLYMLIGPKGSGKTHIGTLVNIHTDIKFLRVESIWLACVVARGARRHAAASD